MFSKIADGLSMVWQSLDERERLLVLWGAAGLLWLIASALSMPRKRDELELEQPTLPVIVVVRDERER